ncbi:hypothetical protein B0H17DRAFT_1128105 [Mycena rosella]|uniref:Uncharacterized protein n=1 Tax=Mycena rosella TaxID=1033263 RepID=A0AAD7DX66_MYCRO|nr:hypothetical protein B0H17DRAFT_1128105 [Mycena rosella]
MTISVLFLVPTSTQHLVLGTGGLEAPTHMANAHTELCYLRCTRCMQVTLVDEHFEEPHLGAHLDKGDVTFLFEMFHLASSSAPDENHECESGDKAPAGDISP